MTVRQRTVASMVATLLVVSLPLLAQSPRVRTSVSKSSVTVGEPVTLVVEVFVPTWFSGAPQFPEITVNGAIVTRSDQTLNLTEQFDYDTWAGQRREYSVIPLKTGTLTIAPFDVTVRYALDGAKPSDPTPVTTKSIEISASVPPEAEGLESFIASTRLTVDEKWEAPSGEMKAGDSVTRTVTVRAVNVPSVLLPSMGIENVPDGIAAYGDPPSTRDEGGERGTVRTGSRVEQVTYVFEREGSYELVPVEVSWWDPGVGKVRVSSSKGRTFEIAPNSDFVPEIPPPPPAAGPVVRQDRTLRVRLFVEVLREGIVPLALNVALGALLAWALIRLIRAFSPVIARILEERRTAEPAMYRELSRAAASGDARAVWNALHEWMRRAGVSRANAGRDLTREMDRLDRTLFGPPEGGWDGRVLLAAVDAERRKRSVIEKSVSTLPALNP